MFHLEVKRKFGGAELPSLYFDVDDNTSWEQLMDALQLECAAGEHPVYVAFGEVEDDE